jgi:hypothetical protein
MITWLRQKIFYDPGHRQDTHYADYEMLDAGKHTGIEVRWCRHPTALRKYWVLLSDGSALEHQNLDGDSDGTIAAFRTVAEAKLAAIAAYTGFEAEVVEKRSATPQMAACGNMDIKQLEMEF